MKIIIAAGGTGGHIYPALTLGEALKKRGHQILFVGSINRMEKDLIPSKGFEFVGLDVEIFNGNILKRIKSLISIYNATKKCEELVKDYDVAIGFGNYISLPVILAAKKMGLKTIIHEQNSYAGKANLFLDKKVDVVIGSYEENKKQFKNKNTLIIGNPQSSKAINIIKDNKILKNIGLNPNKKTVVIFMGSLGSESINNVILDYFKFVDGSYQIIYATGKNYYQMVKESNVENDFIKCFEYVDGVSLMKNSTLLVCRAGATTLSEITAMGMPAILIPSPYVPNNHQYYNAKALVDRNAALMIEEKDLTSRKLNDMISDTINNDTKLKMLSDAAMALGSPLVLENMITVIEEL